MLITLINIFKYRIVTRRNNDKKKVFLGNKKRPQKLFFMTTHDRVPKYQKKVLWLLPNYEKNLYFQKKMLLQASNVSHKNFFMPCSIIFGVKAVKLYLYYLIQTSNEEKWGENRKVYLLLKKTTFYHASWGVKSGK